MNIFTLAFFFAALLLSKRISDSVKKDSSQHAATNYFRNEKKFLKRHILVSIIAFIVILLFRKTIITIALGACLIYAIYIAFILYKRSKEILGKNERYAVRLYTAGKITILYMALCLIGNWLC